VGRLRSANVSSDRSGDVVMPYLPLCPPQGTGYHRVVVVLLEQTEKKELPFLQSLLQEGAGELGSLASRNASFLNLEKALAARAVSFAFAQTTWDNSVPATFSKLLQIEEPRFQESPAN
jgi:phosphatidylethanolamine-binding protein (PEBP) family uncharacterized protein